jgi:hypothetical protein
MMNKCENCKKVKEIVNNKIFHNIGLCSDCIYGLMSKNEE